MVGEQRYAESWRAGGRGPSGPRPPGHSHQKKGRPMPASLVKIAAHCVWATWDRQPFITDALCDKLYAAIVAKCWKLGAKPLALGGVEDHVHLLVRIPATVDVARLVGEVKGSSSHLMNTLQSAFQFKWQGSYSAFGVSDMYIPTTQTYIRNQRQHHTIGGCLEIQAMDAAEKQPDEEPGIAINGPWS